MPLTIPGAHKVFNLQFWTLLVLSKCAWVPASTEIKAPTIFCCYFYKIFPFWYIEYRSMFKSTVSFQVNTSCFFIWSCAVLLVFLFIFYPLHRMTFFSPHPFPGLNSDLQTMCNMTFVMNSLQLFHCLWELLVSLTEMCLTFWRLSYWSHLWRPHRHSRIVNSQRPVAAI